MSILMDLLRKPAKRHDELLSYIYAFTMVSAQQLAALMETEKGTVVTYVHRLNKKGEMVISHHPPRSKRIREKLKEKIGPRMYSLGIDGLRVMEELLEIDISQYQVKGRQSEHYWGITETFIRLYQALGYDEVMERIEWHNTKEASRMFVDNWHQLRGRKIEDKFKYMEEKKELPRPDFRMLIDTVPIWGEYDTGSSGLNQKVIPKMKLYTKWMLLLQDQTPILWVTDQENRRDNLKEAWESVKADPVYDELKDTEGFFFPKMNFITLDQVPRLGGRTINKMMPLKNDL